MTGSSSKQPLIDKKTIYAGTKNVNFRDGAKVYFHFQTRLCDADKTVLDDSRKMGTGKPMELVLGKKFKLEVWEIMVQKMSLNEVAEFRVNKDLVLQYPFVSRTLRDISLGKQTRTHQCAMTIQTEGVGYQDLDYLMKNPQDLEFTIELVQVDQPEDYEKETWQLTEDERLKEIPQLKEKGNDEFRNKNFIKAADHYYKALGLLDQLMLLEKPQSEDWDKLNKQKIPILLNYSQCKLNEGDYYAVIQHCTTVLESEPDNVKALYRRAKAHVGAWNPNEAKQDFTKVIELDPSLTASIKKELQTIDDLVKRKDDEDKKKFKNLFTK